MDRSNTDVNKTIGKKSIIIRNQILFKKISNYISLDVKWFLSEMVSVVSKRVHRLYTILEKRVFPIIHYVTIHSPSLFSAEYNKNWFRQVHWMRRSSLKAVRNRSRKSRVLASSSLRPKWPHSPN